MFRARHMVSTQKMFVEWMKILSVRIWVISEWQKPQNNSGLNWIRGSQEKLVVKNPPANAGDVRDLGSILGEEDPLEEGTATCSSILAWRIPWTEDPGGL